VQSSFESQLPPRASTIPIAVRVLLMVYLAVSRESIIYLYHGQEKVPLNGQIGVDAACETTSYTLQSIRGGIRPRS
jgi:hypothetical protein